MNRPTSNNSFVVGAVAIGVIAGVAVGFFTAHRMMTDDMKQRDIQGMPMEGTMLMKDMGRMGEASASAPVGRAGEMEGMPVAPSGVVAIPAAMRQLIGVRSAPVTYASLGQEIRTVGTVGYDERGLAQVTVKTSGWVREVFVDSIGRPVRKGEPLFTLYSPDLLATQDEYLLALRTQGQLAASPLAEVTANAGSLVASSRERLRLWDVTDLQIATLERRGTAEPVLTVYAPASGIVLKREALPGKYVEPGTTLYEVADLSTVWISADIYESEVAAVTLNQPASVTFAAYPGKIFRGNVSYIYPSLNTEARTVRVRVELPNPGLKLKPGMYGNVILQTEAVHTLVVPKEAVLETGLRQLVFLDRGQGRYEPASVKLGRRSQDEVEVLEGLKEGDRIVTSANFLLDAESKLTSASSMQAMMGRIGMADWQMRGAHEGKMEGMEGMQGMGDMAGMKGMELTPVIVVTETRQAGGLTLSLSTVPEKPKAGEILLRLNVTDQAGKPVTNAQVVFVYTMPMPGMSDSKATARHTKDGLYEGTVLFGMGGTWLVTVNLTVPGRPPVAEKFQFSVAGGGM
ncbi:MAG: efflux RND transporter periplasmic adaptor subunit [Nitrospira sp.]|nr:efflux RND transporter periplasmic adaptor subunit [Nitrospira sp.]